MKNILPCVLCLIDIAAAIVCGFDKDWPRVMYWLSAASITASTLWMK
jgi:hypothetical protein